MIHDHDKFGNSNQTDIEIFILGNRAEPSRWPFFRREWNTVYIQFNVALDGKNAISESFETEIVSSCLQESILAACSDGFF